MSSLPVSEGDVEASDFPLKAAGRARLLLSRFEVWKSSILSS